MDPEHALLSSTLSLATFARGSELTLEKSVLLHIIEQWTKRKWIDKNAELSQKATISHLKKFHLQRTLLSSTFFFATFAGWTFQLKSEEWFILHNNTRNKKINTRIKLASPKNNRFSPQIDPLLEHASFLHPFLCYLCFLCWKISTHVRRMFFPKNSFIQNRDWRLTMWIY